MKKYGLRRVGLCLGALASMMTFVITSAQAEVGSHWNVNGSSISDSLVENGVVPDADLENNHGVLFGHALGKELDILCTGIHLEEARLKLEGGSLLKVEFLGCRITTNGGEVLPACEPHTGAAKGVILTVLLKDLIILHEGPEAYDRLEPHEGNRFVEVITSSSCAFGEKIPILTEAGKGFVVKDCNLEFRVEKVTHLVEEGPLTKLWTYSKTAEHEARIAGSANVFLVGEHKGLKWSATPR